MKIKTLPLSIFVIAMSFVLSSYENGAARHTGWDGTGAETNSGCSNGGGCHNATTSLNTTVELDSAGAAVTSYRPGGTYTVKISATNNTSGTFADFGFQLATVLTAGAGTSSPTQAGTWGTLPASVRTTSLNSISIIEQNTHIAATTGTGAVGTTYVESIPWTAPAAGSGSVSICGVINAVSGLDVAFLADYQAATPVTITEAVATGINELSDQLTGFTAYPTVMNDKVTIAFDLKESTVINLTLMSMQGQTVRTWMSGESQSQGSFNHSFDVSGLSQGVYLVRLQIGNQSLVSKVIKE